MLKQEALVNLEKRLRDRRNKALQDAIASRVEFVEDFPAVVAEELLKDFVLRCGYDKSRPLPDFRIELKVARYEQVSNTHRCPRSGVTNWNQSYNRVHHPSLPTGYPGWYGNIRLYYGKELDRSWDQYDVNRTLDTIGLNLGSGSGTTLHDGSHIYRAEVSIFDDDFPKLAEMHKKMLMVAKLTV